ncbi:MAG: hypothetical protein Q9163_001712 [Psora crenata]
MLTDSITAALAVLLLTATANGDGIYTKSSPVLQVDGKSYNKLITKSNQVSIVEFYAPWCGHCQNLKPKYEKAAKSLKDLAQVAAVNCDEETNKPLCSAEGVQGFPTLKIIKPSKKAGKPVAEEYRGQREAKDIVEAVKSAIPNNVKRITDKGLGAWLESDNSTAKAILFSDKGVTSALTKVLANEFLGTMNFAQIRNKEAAANKMFGITAYPTLLILPGGITEPIVYDGAFSKSAMKDFLAKYASSAGSSKLKDKVKDKVKQAVRGDTESSEPVKAAEEDQESFSSASSSHQASEASAEAAGATSVTIVDESNPTESPEPATTPKSKPINLPNTFKPVPSLESQSELQSKCLGDKTSTCVLAILPAIAEEPDATLGEPSTTALASLAEIAAKHKERKGNLFPFYAIPATNPGAAVLRDALSLGDVGIAEVIAVNGRRRWYRKYDGKDFSPLSVENWVDNIRFGEGTKAKLPADLLLAGTERVSEESTGTTEEEPPAVPTHGEL